MKRPGLLGRIRKATQKMLKPRNRPDQVREQDVPPVTPDEIQARREYEAAARANKRDRKAMIHRKIGKGISGELRRLREMQEADAMREQGS